MAGKDAAAEYDELAEPQDFQDDPEYMKHTQFNFSFIKVAIMRMFNSDPGADPSLIYSTVWLPSGSPTRLVSS